MRNVVLPLQTNERVQSDERHSQRPEVRQRRAADVVQNGSGQLVRREAGISRRRVLARGDPAPPDRLHLHRVHVGAGTEKNERDVNQECRGEQSDGLPRRSHRRLKA